MKQLPDLGRAAKLLKISVELEGVDPETILGYSILKGLRDGKLGEVIKMVKDQIPDNKKMLSEIIGNDLLKEIEGL